MLTVSSIVIPSVCLSVRLSRISIDTKLGSYRLFVASPSQSTTNNSMTAVRVTWPFRVWGLRQELCTSDLMYGFSHVSAGPGSTSRLQNERGHGDGTLFIYYIHFSSTIVISGPPSDTWFFAPTRVHTPSSILIVSTIFALLWSWQTDHATLSV